MRIHLSLGAVVLFASSAMAQSVPSISRTKAAATSAVTAANARTQASSTLPVDTAARPAAAPSTKPVATDSAGGAAAVLPSPGAAFERET